MKISASRSRSATANALLLPGLLVLLLVVVVPLVDLIIQSLRPQPGTIGGATFGNYTQVVTSPLYESLMWKTLYTCVAATIITLVIAAPAAWAMTRIAARRRPVVMLLLAIPYLTSFILLIYSMLVLLAAHGPLMELLGGLHLANSGSSILYTPWATLVMLVYESIPIATLVLYPVFDRIEPSLLLAARGLGATTRHVLLKVLLPLSRNGLVAAAALVFIPLAGVFAEPEILGGPNGYLFGNIINDEVQSAFNPQLGAAMSVILVVYVLALIAILLALFAIWRRCVTMRLPRPVLQMLRLHSATLGAQP